MSKSALPPLNLPPLPKALDAAVRGALGAHTAPAGANPGLVWERYPNVWRGVEIADARSRADFLRRFAEDVSSAPARAAGEGALQALHARFSRAGATGRAFALIAPLCSGLGLEHPSENGFAFDPVLGLPWLAGSGLKGLARAAAAALGEPDVVVEALLGSAVPDGHGAGEATAPGVVRLWGAWPGAWPRLRVELISPHHPAYQADQTFRYAGDLQARGRDQRRSLVADHTDEPVPVSFLALDHSQELIVYLDAMPGQSPDLERVWWWLAVGFEHLGAGGKTASGYGRARPAGWAPATYTLALPEPAPAPTAEQRQVLVVTGPIGTLQPQANEAQLKRNIAAELGVGAETVVLRTLKLPAVERGAGWTPTIEALRSFIEDTEGSRDGAFGFARIPVLAAFGALLGDKGTGQTWDAPRGLEQGAWDPQAGALRFDVSTDRKREGVDGVVVRLELSGAIDDAQVPTHLRDLPQATLRVKDTTPVPGVIRSREHLNQFRAAWRELISKVREHFGAVPLHLLAAAPLSAAVVCGRALVAADAPVHVYEAAADATRVFQYGLSVTAGDAYEDPRLKHTGPVDLLIMVALIEEAEQLLKVLGDVTPVEDDHGYSDLYVVRQGRTIVVRTCDAMGPNAAQAATSGALKRWQPKVAAWLGIAGALSTDLKLCDAIVPDQVSHYDATGKLVDEPTGPQQSYRPEVFRPDQALARRVSGMRLTHAKPFEQWQRQGETDLNAEIKEAGGDSATLRGKHARARPNLYKSHLASGSSVVSAQSAKDRLLATDASLKAVDMESAGLAWAAESAAKAPPLLIVRGISDDGSEHKKALDAVGEGAFRRVAMRNASRLLLLALDLGLLKPNA
jgi:nucleoside phosphorylase/CRISPR/Cas system CMR subunit Cmr6 (Cas7 group RAMP superfamily)